MRISVLSVQHHSAKDSMVNSLGLLPDLRTFIFRFRYSSFCSLTTSVASLKSFEGFVKEEAQVFSFTETALDAHRNQASHSGNISFF